MKTRFLTTLLAAIACASVSSIGQTPVPPPSGTPPPAPSVPSAPLAAPSPSVPPPRRFQLINPEQRDALKAAAAKAQQDPKVQAAAQKLREATKAFQDAMVAKESSLGPLIAKIQGGVPRISLTPAERMQLRQARDSMRGTPEAGAMQKAMFDYREALRQSIESSDPSLTPILEKMPLGSAGMGRWFGGPDGADMAKPSASPSAAAK